MAEPLPTRYTLGDPADEVSRIHIYTDDGQRWYVSNWCGQWLDARGQWDWPPRGADGRKQHREMRRARRTARQWDYTTALKLAQAAYEEAKK